MAIGEGKRAAVKGLLAGIMKASLAATRSLEGLVDGADTVKAERMNMICSEYLWFHMWRACKRAQRKMSADAYREFTGYAVKGMAVMAAGCFTGLFDKKVEAEFVVGMESAFVRLEKCGPEQSNAMASKGPMGTTSRRIARLAGRGGDPEMVNRAMLAGMESFNASRVESGVDGVIQAV